jgi:Ala-tRNA(Pro) deacylase
MAITPSVQEFLRFANVRYTVIPHPRALTALREASVTHVPSRDWAKTVVCFADGEPIEAVLPADHVVNLDWLAILVGARDVWLAREDELRWLYPECEVGAMSPLGRLFGQAVYVDQSLAGEEEIVFDAGTHTDAVAMRYADFAALTRPVVGRFAMRLPADRFH